MTLSGHRALARQALRAALTVRARAGVSIERALCVYDVANHLGLEVRFVAGSTLGGLYARDAGVILVPAERPPGRQAFTCAHELGHWFFGHGTRVDELLDIDADTESEPQELLVNAFAGYLLMPAKAIDAAFARRRWNPRTATPLQIYVVATQLGVGYGTLVGHLRWSAGILSVERSAELLRISPKSIRTSILADAQNATRLVVVDEAWCDVPVDLSVGDLAIIPKDSALEGVSVRIVATHELGVVLAASLPGLARVQSNATPWATFVRVSRRGFVGRSIYRHCEDPDAEPA